MLDARGREIKIGDLVVISKDSKDLWLGRVESTRKTAKVRLGTGSVYYRKEHQVIVLDPV